MMNFINKLLLGSFITLLTGIILFNTLNAQETNFRDQSWRYGLNAALQFNSVSLGYQKLHEPFPSFASTDFKKDNSDGKGLAFFGGLFGEYLSDSWWGLQLRVSYDVRDALIKDTTTMPGREMGAEYASKMNYLSWELMFRADQRLIPNLSIYAGPIIAVNIHGTYDYTDKKTGIEDSDVKVDNRNIVAYGLSGGLAYDIQISKSKNSAMYLSPFAEASWIVNQKKTDYAEQNSVTDVWSTLSLRFGLRLSFECFKAKEEKMAEVITPAPAPAPAPKKIVEPPPEKMVFLVMPVDNTIVSKNINGYFPILPYVFFEKGNNEITGRYIILSKEKAKDFSETDLENFRKGEMSVKETNIDQLMFTYYNVMNIYADRMRKNPKEQLLLRGCDPEEKDGESYANKVKTYLVSNFGISANRIKIIVESPKKPSGSDLTDPQFNNYINDENRRVVFVFNNQDMYKPVPYTIRDLSSIDNDILFSISDNIMFKSWKISISGENNTVNFGPFTSNRQRINPAPLMRGIEEGKFIAKVDITMKDGKQVTENVDFKLKKSKESKNASRYLMIFDYNKSDAVLTYETKNQKRNYSRNERRQYSYSSRSY